MSPSDAPNFTRPTPDCEIDFRSQFHSTDFADSACAEGLNGWAEVGWFASPFSDISDISMFRKPVWLAVQRLYLAARLATDCKCERQEFSVGRDELAAMDLRREELKWLLIKNIVKESLSVLDPDGCESHPIHPAEFDSSAMFVITDFGIELVGQCLTEAQLRRTEDNNSKQTSSAQQDLKPSWDCERHELRCGGKVVKKFKWRAANQETILATFEEEGWPAHIDDPLPQDLDIDPKRRLADAIKSLNRHQKSSLVRFCGDGTGQGVLWELK